MNKIINKLRNYLLAGLVFLGPIIVTIIIIRWFINFFDNTFESLIPAEVLAKMYIFPGIGVILGMVILIIIGFLGTNFLGKYILKLGDKLVNKVPVIKIVYSTVKQIFETLFSNNAKAFRGVVLIEYPRKGLWTIAFVTSEVNENKEMFDKFCKVCDKEEKLLSVFVPTTPNPTSGFLIYVKKEEAIFLDMPPSTAMKLIISGGAISNTNEE